MKGKPLSGIDKLVHEPARLSIMAHLYVVESADFLFLKRQTGLSDGNLSSHLSKLEKANYVEVKKEFVGRKPHTMISLSKKGRSAFRDYAKKMKRVFKELPG